MTTSTGEESPISPESNPGIAFYLGHVGSRETTKVIPVESIVGPDGSFGLRATEVEKLLGKLGGDKVLWICTEQPPGHESSSEAEYKIHQFIDGRVEVNTGRHSLFIEGDETHLSPKEFNLLEALAINAGIVLTRQQIIDRVWNDAGFARENCLAVLVGQLRKKFGETYRPMLRTVPYVGYMLDKTFDPEAKP